MPTDTPQGGRRHFHRGRRGNDRRGPDRRTQHELQQQPSPDQPPRGDHVDVEQIMREIRARIAQRHGIDLTDQQVEELAARRLEAILDPRTIKPSLLDQLRRGAGARPDSVAAADRAEAPFEFEDTTLYDSHRGLLRAIRKLLNPILKLFFNPNPLVRALHIQSRLNVDAVQREAQRDQRQAEWNALHYEIVQRLVTEVSRVTLEIQSLTLRVESLSTKVDFNERRVRGIEGTLHQGRPFDSAQGKLQGPREPAPTAVPIPEHEAASAAAAGPAESVAGEAPRRRRRRRRGRRGGGFGEVITPAGIAGTPTPTVAVVDDDHVDESAEADGREAMTTDGEEEPFIEALQEHSEPITAPVSQSESERQPEPQREPEPPTGPEHTFTAPAPASVPEPFDPGQGGPVEEAREERLPDPPAEQ